MEWIATSERLPEQNKYVLFWDGENLRHAVGKYVVEHYQFMGVTEHTWISDGGYGDEYGVDAKDVPAWAELPEPWEFSE
jgi:hypothetical protein